MMSICYSWWYADVKLHHEYWNLTLLWNFSLDEGRNKDDIFFCIVDNYLGQKVKNAVITVPAYFNDSQRQVQLSLLVYSEQKSSTKTKEYMFVHKLKRPISSDLGNFFVLENGTIKVFKSLIVPFSNTKILPRWQFWFDSW